MIFAAVKLHLFPTMFEYQAETGNWLVICMNSASANMFQSSKIRWLSGSWDMIVGSSARGFLWFPGIPLAPPHGVRSMVISVSMISEKMKNTWWRLGDVGRCGMEELDLTISNHSNVMEMCWKIWNDSWGIFLNTIDLCVIMCFSAKTI